MSNRDNLRHLSGLIASGKDGYVNAINAFAPEYKADASILPSEWADLSAKQTVVHFGGYLVAHKGFNAEQVYGYANVISAYYAEIDLTVDGKTINSQLSRLEERLETEHLAESNRLLALGETGEKLAQGIVRDTKSLAAAATAVMTPKMVDRITTAIRELEALLPVGEVAQFPVDTGVKVAI
ncbi:hypothetical protein UFOVP27_140 [uncultured Caudovirales phage]|uniref:Uncharacterized protein n=1 Tax=uncultured Caudovirales phage TaxID=2100421 RepID=A0A6J5KLF8_9CAUD|nr:hypothetical protein UFOVP27_140 [uncultured Caudovirales phage]